MGGASTICGVFMLCLVIIHCHTARADTYTVGDDKGWDYDVSPWPLGRSFKHGDVLVFNYDPSSHNVVVLVKEQDFNDCRVPIGSKTFNTGHDSIPLNKGYNYFISNVGQDCIQGMAMMVQAD